MSAVECKSGSLGLYCNTEQIFWSNLCAAATNNKIAFSPSFPARIDPPQVAQVWAQPATLSAEAANGQPSNSTCRQSLHFKSMTDFLQLKQKPRRLTFTTTSVFHYQVTCSWRAPRPGTTLWLTSVFPLFSRSSHQQQARREGQPAPPAAMCSNWRPNLP